MRTHALAKTTVLVFVGLAATTLSAQTPRTGTVTPAATPASASVGVTAPPDYVIGPDDVLSVFIWRDKDLSSDVLVRPDGKVTLPVINEVQAAGLTPDELRLTLTKAYAKFLEEPIVTVQAKQINSRKVFITGQISKPGPYPIMGPLNVLQLITLAGGVLEYADSENIQVIRMEKGTQIAFRVNYKDLSKGRNLPRWNIELKPGDQIVVP
jgi:polysaccharide biosynthesis/export protein